MLEDTVTKRKLKEALEKVNQDILERKKREGDFEIKLSNGLVGKFIPYKKDKLALVLNSVPGPQGEKGEAGSPGEIGIEGLIGELGPQGPKGDKGKPGAFGLRGGIGPKGEVGERGLTGIKGDIGPRGEKGGQGLEGLIGKTGAKGDTGDIGSIGDTGVQGPKGIKGDRGERGIGVPGSQGERGIQGEQGLQGLIGPEGKQGLTGNTPDHEWGGTQIRFKKPNDKWGVFVDLKGPPGEAGAGRSVLSPAIFTGPKTHERNSDPTVNDDEYHIGDSWINLTSDTSWILVDDTKGAAVWIQSGGLAHAAITLDANAETLLSLSIQELGLDTQIKNLTFAGPATGADAVPTFRSLVAADIPTLDHTTKLSNVGTNTHTQIDTHVALVNEHIDWEAASAGTIHIDNYIEGGAGTDTTAIHDDTINEITALAQVTPLAADEFIIEDNSDSYNKKAVLFSALEAALTHDNLIAGTIAGHDTTATGTQLNTLIGGGDADTLHIHASGATKELDNLASVAINTSLVSDTDNTDDLGATGKRWKDLYLSGNLKDDTTSLSIADLKGPIRTIVCTAAGGTPTTTAGCADPAHTEWAAQKDFWSLDFDGATDEHAFWGPFLMPENYSGGTFTAIFKWTTTATDADGVCWSIKLLSLQDGDDISVASWGSAVDTIDNAQSNADDILISASSTAITPGGTASAPEALWVLIYRDVSNGSDNMAEDAKLISAKLEYTCAGYSD